MHFLAFVRLEAHDDPYIALWSELYSVWDQVQNYLGKSLVVNEDIVRHFRSKIVLKLKFFIIRFELH